MENNLVENSDSLTHKVEEHMNTGDNTTTTTTHEPVVPPETEEKLDAKPDDEITEKAMEDSDHVVEGGDQEPKEEEKNEEKEEKEEEETVEITPPDSPPPSLEKISEDIDDFLVALQHNAADANKEAAIKLEIPNFIPTFLQIMEEKIAKYETSEAKWGDTEEEDSSFLECVNRISKLLKHFIEYHAQFHDHDHDLPPAEEEQEENKDKEEDKAEDENKNKDKVKGKIDFMINGIGAIQQRAMSFLEDEFRRLMEESRNQAKPAAADSKGKQPHAAESPEATESPAEPVTDFPCLAEETVTKLSKIAKEMIAGGYENECCHVYAISRKNAFEDAMHKELGYEKISIDEVQKMQWEALEREIPTWINTWKECTSVWFPGEKRLAESVFAEEFSANKATTLFGNLFHGIVIQLINFGESVAMTKRAGEKLFKLLDMYETLRDVIPVMESLFPRGIVWELKYETTSAKCRLGEAAVLIFCDLENSIKSEAGKTPVANGAVHPLTRYIMNYLRLACEYKDTLEVVFKEHSKIERADSTSMPRYEDIKPKYSNKQKEDMSPFAAQLMRVMELLDSNLEGKAKLYKEIPLSSIFMMNNGRYIVQKIKFSAEIYEVMGETWCRKRSTELRTYHKNYQVETWSKILSYLSPKGLNDNGKVHKPVLKERFKSFNAAFEEIHKTQSAWVVSDKQLQSELRVSIAALVIPAYRSFLGRFSQILDPGRQTEKYIKYQAEDVESCIDELFDGNSHLRR